MAVPYMVPDDLRSVAGLEDVTGFPDATLARLVAVFEAAAESYRGVAFTPRVATEQVWLGYGSSERLVLSWPKVRSITSVTVDGTAIDSSLFQVTDVGDVFALGGFYGLTATVVYSHGYDVPTDGNSWPGSAMLLQACRTYVRSKAKLEKSNVGRDQISAIGPEGGTIQYSTPNIAQGRPTGYLEVDELLNLLPDHRVPGVG